MDIILSLEPEENQRDDHLSSFDALPLPFMTLSNPLALTSTNPETSGNAPPSITNAENVCNLLILILKEGHACRTNSRSASTKTSI